MKKYLLLLSVPMLFSCESGTKKQTALIDSLSTANTNTKTELSFKEDQLKNKEALVSEFINAFNEIQGNLNEIKAKEKIISQSSEKKEFKKSNKDIIISDIQAIYDLLDKNKQKIVSVSKKLKNSTLKISEVELAVANLTNQLSDKESEISDLKNKLEELNVDFADLKVRYVEEQQESDFKTEKLNTAYYVVGTKKDLTNKGLITKKGGFIGIGKVAELSSTFDENYFTKIDISKTMEIPIHGDKVKLVSIHPSNSYKLVEGSASIDKIVILDVEKFWSTSKYLIITSEK